MYIVHDSELSCLLRYPPSNCAMSQQYGRRSTCTTRPEFYYSTDFYDEFIGYARITQWLPRSPVAILLAVTSYVPRSALMENHFACEQSSTTMWRPAHRKSTKNIGILYTYIYYIIDIYLNVICRICSIYYINLK